MPYAHCPACFKSQYECVCAATCDLCGIRTDHSTQEHEQAQGAKEEALHADVSADGRQLPVGVAPWSVRADRDAERMRHQLTFRGEAVAIPAGYGLCTRCGALLDIEAWLVQECPQHPPEEKRHDDCA